MSLIDTRRPLLADVATRASVSIATASRALNGRGELSDETRRTVLRAAAELEFRPSPAARSLRTRRSLTIGLVVPHISHAFYAGVTQGAQATLEESGYNLILIDSGEATGRVEKALRTLVDQEVDGLLLSTARVGSDSFEMVIGATPCVCIDELRPGLGVGNVVLENAKGLGLLVDHIAGHGHSRIGYLSGPEDRSSGRERRRGFADAMVANGLATEPELVRTCDWTIESGYHAAIQLLGADRRPEAIVAASAEIALGALAAARGSGLSIPGDLALVSFDDLYFAPLLEPPLTAVSYDTHSIGSEAAHLLLAAIKGGTSGWREARINVGLVLRRSCGCPYDPTSALRVEVA